jgi:hypothetical protein
MAHPPASEPASERSSCQTCSSPPSSWAHEVERQSRCRHPRAPAPNRRDGPDERHLTGDIVFPRRSSSDGCSRSTPLDASLSVASPRRPRRTTGSLYGHGSLLATTAGSERGARRCAPNSSAQSSRSPSSRFCFSLNELAARSTRSESAGRLVSMIRLLRLALQVVLFFLLLSLVIAVGAGQTGILEKVALIAAGVVLVWLASCVRRIGAPVHHM